MRALIQTGDPQRFHEVNEAFHSTIYAGAHNAYLAEMTLATRSRVQPFRRAQFRALGRLAQSHAEHDRVVVAILRGERERAADRHARAYRDGSRSLRDLRQLALVWGPELERIDAVKSQDPNVPGQNSETSCTIAELLCVTADKSRMTGLPTKYPGT